MGISWNARYRSKPASSEPSELLTAFSSLLPERGRALDLACGGGRHSVFLAQHGLSVTGVDASDEALRQARELARQKNVRVDFVQADLERFALPRATFDVVACFYYRDPNLYAPLGEALVPGGLLFYETYTLEQLRFDSGPRNPAHLLEPGELRAAFRRWQVIFYREQWRQKGLASLIARKPSPGS